MASSGLKTAITGAASTIASADLTIDRSVISNGSGKIDVSTTTSTELGYVSGVTSAIQTQIDAKQDEITASNQQFIYQNGSGVIEGASGWNIDSTSGGLNLSLTEEPNGLVANTNVHNQSFNFDPIANSPDESWTIEYRQANIDTQADGFSFGINGQSVKLLVQNVVHGGQSDIGSVEFIQNNFALGNGTDAIDVKGLVYAFGFGTINANVNMSGPMLGYGYQYNVNASATISNSAYCNGFYDSTNIACPAPNYISFNASPNIASIQNNSNYQGFTCNPNITTFTGNAGAFPVQIGGNWGTFNTGSWNGVNINPTITQVSYAAGINVTMDNVTVYAGTVASLVIQDLTIASDLPSSFANTITVEYTSGGTAGSEVVSGAVPAFQVQIESGVSTATQIAAALNGYLSFTQNFNVTISGVGSNPQVTQAATNLAGGTDPGRKQAAYLDGDVEVTGALSFGGALSIGQLNAFASQAIVDGGGVPVSIHSLVTSPTVAANTTVVNGDTLGINTAMLLSMGDNAVVTTSFVGVSALALPAVVSMGTGATIDRLAGATFALSLDGGATGGTIDTLALCRSLAIPNGITSVTRLYGYEFDLPFGDPSTDAWGIYMAADTNNWIKGSLRIGGTTVSNDTVTNSSIALELTDKAIRLATMDTTARDALTAVAGMVIFNTTTSALEYYDGSAWV